MQLKPLNTFTITLMFFFTFLFLFFSGFLEFPSVSTSINARRHVDPSFPPPKSTPEPFTDVLSAFKKWDSQVGCAQFREKYRNQTGSKSVSSGSGSLQEDGEGKCDGLKMEHVSLLVKGWTWIPDNLDNLYSCRCGLSCLWTKSSVLADKPDALLFETTTPPIQRRNGDPLRVYMDLEAGRKRSGLEDIFISYHAKDDVQSTYAGALFHNGRNYQVSSDKNNDTLVYWSSSRCLPQRNRLAKNLLSLLPHHSFGKCLNNVGGPDMALSLYPECNNDASVQPRWWDHLHCAMSHYKFVLAIENTVTESYVTEKLFYALDSGSVPIYFGAPNVWDFVPPHSIIDGSKFRSLEKLASYVKALANDPVAYAEYHAWRRCGVMGNYGKARAASLDTLPCRLCEAISRKGGRNARAK
ncbi:alpha-(1,4)-fucosyltransferase [Pistacia vera]|uniref:alpha-(1,4)-fucosyltransferase n=1 Tax=Pistacia vera TaxID=55513 RepID=UPI0012637D89|nr:alpha-(1,4)-fucosyltransferase [Pistacia vera]